MSKSIDVTIEIPRGTRNKYEYDHDLHVIRLNRHLTSSMGYPAEYGFFPDTLGGDGDPLDVLVLTEFPTFPGCVIKVRVVGACFMVDEHGDDAKLIAVPAYDPQWKDANDITDIPKRILDEIRHFFSVYKDLDEGKWVKMGNYEGRDAALKELAECQERFRTHQAEA
jgi:inorganic pyrophosphatase